MINESSEKVLGGSSLGSSSSLSAFGLDLALTFSAFLCMTFCFSVPFSSGALIFFFAFAIFWLSVVCLVVPVVSTFAAAFIFSLSFGFDAGFDESKSSKNPAPPPSTSNSKLSSESICCFFT